ncbi:MAG: SDR family NAD(P)-dependent oxidoreductase [Clostridium sp.]|nr:SDR family NAD(P)-dependent oxidoreductase [Prevotella sp.]MCM1429035.1 SDR family NAD(P)-dependent oxidoreductase [Clostridium sp.]MCM1475434.1 SDR family NAD(P)-dependent oxidoreductase [Muribaculaceae bacterium]
MNVIITGASSGIGRSCALKFAAAGYDVVITGRNESKLSSLRDEILALGRRCMILLFDVRDREKASELLCNLPEEWKDVDVLVNNAGLALGLEPMDEGSFDDWDTMIDTNVKALLTVTRLLLPGMKARNKGHIINIGSVAGDAAYAGGGVYCASKAAVKTISDGLRIDLAATDIRVTCVKPGLVETDFSRVRFHGDEKRADAVYTGIDPLTPDDIADATLYAAQAPKHVQIAEILILANHQGSGSVIVRN